MAIFDSDELTEIRQRFSRDSGGGGLPSKAQVNAAAQAVEDLLEAVGTRTAISNAIDGATTPAVMTASQKGLIASIVFYRKARRALGV